MCVFGRCYLSGRFGRITFNRKWLKKIFSLGGSGSLKMREREGEENSELNDVEVFGLEVDSLRYGDVILHVCRKRTNSISTWSLVISKGIAWLDAVSAVYKVSNPTFNIRTRNTLSSVIIVTPPKRMTERASTTPFWLCDFARIYRHLVTSKVVESFHKISREREKEREKERKGGKLTSWNTAPFMN